MTDLKPVKYMELKMDLVPNISNNYLGAQVMKKIINGISCWTMSSEQYVKAAIANVENKLDKEGQCLFAIQMPHTNESGISA